MISIFPIFFTLFLYINALPYVTNTGDSEVTPAESVQPYNIKQYTYKELVNRTIQWNYATAPNIEFTVLNCKDQTFEQAKDGLSQIQVLFNTPQYTIIQNNDTTDIGFKVICSKGIHNIHWFQLAVPYMDYDPSKPYTQITIDVGKCHKEAGKMDRRLKGIEILYRSYTDTKAKHTVSPFGGPKWFSPGPSEKCTTINSFKTPYLDSITMFDTRL